MISSRGVYWGWEGDGGVEGKGWGRGCRYWGRRHVLWSIAVVVIGDLDAYTDEVFYV